MPSNQLSRLLIPVLFILYICTSQGAALSNSITTSLNYIIEEWGHGRYVEVELNKKNMEHRHSAPIIICNRENGTMRASGRIVAMTDLMSKKGQLWCKHFVQRLEVFAVQKVIFDRDLNAPGVSVTIMALDWHVYGQRTINLSGSKGSPGGSERRSVKRKYELDGKPGGPGQNGGNFLGHYSDRFIKSEESSSLAIICNGGDGGDGESGRVGIDGKNGENGKYSDFPQLSSNFNSLVNSWEKPTYIYSFGLHTELGKSGTPGGRGGNGGVGGFGGYPGFIYISTPPKDEENDSIFVERMKGQKGQNGKGGKGGRGGLHGRNYQCTWSGLGLLGNAIRFWSNCEYKRVSRNVADLFAASGVSGHDGWGNVGLQKPSPLKSPKAEFAESKRRYKQYFNHYRRYLGL